MDRMCATSTLGRLGRLFPTRPLPILVPGRVRYGEPRYASYNSTKAKSAPATGKTSSKRRPVVSPKSDTSLPIHLSRKVPPIATVCLNPKNPPLRSDSSKSQLSPDRTTNLSGLPASRSPPSGPANGSTPLKHRTANSNSPWQPMQPAVKDEPVALPKHRKLDDVLYPGDTQLLRLPWGGQLSYARLGRKKEAGPTWVLFHSTPGCRLIWHWEHIFAEDYGIRIVAVDRPGYGYSTLDDSRRMLDHVNDVEHLLDHLGIEQFKVHGVSGGGPFALAAAYHFSKKRLLKTSIMCGATHPDFKSESVPIEWRVRSFLDAWRVPFWNRERDFERILAWDIANAKGDVHEIKRLEAVMREKMSQGSAGYVNDFRLFCQPWGFSLTEIEANPIRWYHGTLDENTSSNAARETVERVSRGTKVEYLESTGLDHGGIQIAKYRENMDWLAKTK